MKEKFKEMKDAYGVAMLVVCAIVGIYHVTKFTTMLMFWVCDKIFKLDVVDISDCFEEL